MRTHKPIGNWPYVSRRVFLRRAAAALIATLIAVPFVTLGFAFWAASPPPAGNGGALTDHLGEAFRAALIAAAAFWAVAGALFGIVRWIVTGQSPDFPYR